MSTEKLELQWKKNMMDSLLEVIGYMQKIDDRLTTLEQRVDEIATKIISQ